jgi:hypothetical protein
LNEAAFQKFQIMLSGQGVPAEEATWLANLWGELGDFMKSPVGMGAQVQGDQIRVFIFVPGNPEGLGFDMADLESMDNPIGEIVEQLRTRVIGK